MALAVKQKGRDELDGGTVTARARKLLYNTSVEMGLEILFGSLLPRVKMFVSHLSSLDIVV